MHGQPNSGNRDIREMTEIERSRFKRVCTSGAGKEHQKIETKTICADNTDCVFVSCQTINCLLARHDHTTKTEGEPFIYVFRCFLVDRISNETKHRRRKFFGKRAIQNTC